MRKRQDDNLQKSLWHIQATETMSSNSNSTMGEAGMRMLAKAQIHASLAQAHATLHLAELT